MTTPAASTAPAGPAPTLTPPTTPAGTTAPAPEPSFKAPESQADLDRIISTRLNQERAKFAGLTGDEVTAMKAELDKLKAETGTDLERAVREAQTAAEKATEAKFLPLLARAHLDAAAVGKVATEDLSKAVEYVDMSKFITRGQVDTAKVAEFVDSIAKPATGAPVAPRGPIVTPHTPTTAAPVLPGSSARAYLAQRGIKVD